MKELEQIGEGHFRDADGLEYMSIHIYKKHEGFADYLNEEKRNASEALEFKDQCENKFIADWNLSQKYKYGNIYSLNCLREYYKGKPKRLKITIRGKEQNQ